MKTKVLFLAVILGVLVAKPIWAQQQNTGPNINKLTPLYLASAS